HHVVLAALGGRCELIVEVVSPRTRENDVVAKFRHYHQIGIPLYAIIDQQEEAGPRWLRLYRWAAAEYVEVAADDRGRVLLPPLGLRLGMRDGHAVCFNATTGEELGDYSCVVNDLQRERERREQVEEALDEQVQARRDAERRENDALKKAELAQQEADKQRQEADSQRQKADQ